jgi:hypothetical protein
MISKKPVPIAAVVWLVVAAVVLSFPAAARAELIVHSGWDLFVTQPGTQFLGVPFTGVPLEDGYDFGSGIVDVGSIDTIFYREQDAVGVPQDLPGPADAPPIDIEMVALQLVSVGPTDFGAGPGSYYVTLQSERGGTASTGSMTIHFNADHVAPPEPAVGTGTFDFSFDVYFDLRFGALDGPIVMSNVLTMTSDPNSSCSWDHIPLGGTPLIDDVNYLLREPGEGVYPHQDFFPDAFAANHPLATHIVAGPEPATLSFLALGGLALIRRRRK